MTIELLIKDIRNEQNMSLNDLSIKSGISTTHINDLEKNKKVPSLMVMVKLSKAFKKTITELYKIIDM